MWRAQLGQCTDAEGTPAGSKEPGRPLADSEGVRVPERGLPLTGAAVGCWEQSTGRPWRCPETAMHLSADHRAPGARRAAKGLLLFPPHSLNPAQPWASREWRGEASAPFPRARMDTGSTPSVTVPQQRGLPASPAPASARSTVPFRLLGLSPRGVLPLWGSRASLTPLPAPSPGVQPVTGGT